MFFDPAYQSLKNGLIGYWSPVATGPTGLQLLDLSGYNNHGTLNGMDAPTDWVDSPYGKVLDFDGSNDYVLTNTPSSNVLPLGFSARTLSCWFLHNSGNTSAEFFGYGGNSSNGGRFALYTDAGNVIGVEVNGSGVTIPYTRTSSWRFLIATLNGQSNSLSNIAIYLDGLLGSATVSGTNTINTLNTGVTIGTISGAPTFYLFSGRIAECSLWNRALAASEIQTLYNLGPGKLLRSKPNVSIAKRKWWPGVKTPKSRPIIPTQRGIKSGPIFYDPKASWFRNGLVGHWCPSATSPTGTQLLDLSGGNNNGTLTNMPVSTSWVTNGGKGALSFSASNSYVATTKIGAAGSEPRAGFAWINTSVANGAIIEWGANTATQRWQFGIVNTTQYGNTIGQLWVENWGTLRSAGPTVNDGNWHHVGYSYTGGNLNTTLLWIDGISYVANQGTLGTGVVNTATTFPITIGYSLTSASVPFNGVIDDVRVYNRAVTAGEVAKLYAGGRGYGVSSKPYRRSSYSPVTKKIFKSRIDRKRSVSLVHPDHDNEWITNGLVGFWCPSLTGATGTQLLDLSGQNNNGTLTNMDAPTDWVDSPYGTVLDFDGINDGVSTNATNHITTNQVTASIWFKPGRLTRGDLLTRWFGGGVGDQFNLLYGLTSGKPQFYVRGVTNILANTAMNVDQWYLINGVYGNGAISIYMNGVLDRTVAASGTMATDGTTQSYSICRNLSTDGYAQGQCAGALVHERALTPSEIQTLYQLGPRMGFSRRPSRSPTWMVEADETIGNRRRRIICGGKN